MSSDQARAARHATFGTNGHAPKPEPLGPADWQGDRSEQAKGLTWTAVFAPESGDVYDTVEWNYRDVMIKAVDGTVIFSQERVHAPASWSDQAVQVVASKYFHGDAVKGNDPATGGRESSVRQLIHRVCSTIQVWGIQDGYFASVIDADNFGRDLTWLCLNQYTAFNSPVWFNVGLWQVYTLNGDTDNFAWSAAKGRAVPCQDAYERPSCSACFIQPVDDSIDGIMALAASEARLFKHGSGTGTDLSTLRSCREKVRGGGRASGPLSFMRIYDSTAAVIRSGGRTRRSAKIQTLKCSHPDVREFIVCKRDEDRKARAMITSGAAKPGMTGAYDEAYSSVMFQNSNLSVRLTDDFMRAAESSGTLWQTTPVLPTTDEPMPSYEAAALLDLMAECTWECGDPGYQFHDTINAWNTTPNSGEIKSSNPCLRRGTRIFTDAGWKPIEDTDGARLFDGVGFVTGDVWPTGRKPIVRLHMNSGETIDLTSDHRVYTTDGWLVASDCEGKTVPRVLPNVGSVGESSLGKAISGASGRFYSHAAIDLMEALGFIQGDGGFRENVLSIYYTPEKDGPFVENSVLPVLQDIAADRGELDFKAGLLSDSRPGYTICRKKLTDWLASNGFAFVPLPERVLPTFLWSVKQNSQAAFLRGLFGANGNVLKDSRTAIVLVSTCRRMLQEVQLLLKTMGLVSAVRVHNKAQEVAWPNGTYVSKESYHLEITHQQDIAAFARLIGFPQECQQEKLAGIVADGRADKKDGGFVKRAFMDVVRVEALDIEDDVYDFRCPTTSMGLAEGLIVHNCAEYNHLDNSACNLASLNLMKFRNANGTFDVPRFKAAVRTLVFAQDILLDRASYPTAATTETVVKFRQLGLNHANLGALLMVMGLPYDSDEGRIIAGSLTAIMHGTALETSAELAGALGPFEAYKLNREPMRRVIQKHLDAAKGLFDTVRERGAPFYGLAYQGVRAMEAAQRFGWEHGYRNAQSTLMVPNGTTGFMMDCDTFGVEPELALVKYKSLAGGGSMKIVNQSVGPALKALGYSDRHGSGTPGVYRQYLNPPMLISQVHEILDYIASHGTIEGSPHLKPEHLSVFDCSFEPPGGGRSITPYGHIKMLAAIQPFISGASSKTVNLPASATPADIRQVVIDGWKLGVKAMAIYRDGSKGAQPLSTSKAKPEETAGPLKWTSDESARYLEETGLSAALPSGSVIGPSEVASLPSPDGLVGVRQGPDRRRLPDTRASVTHKFSVAGHEGYVTVGLYPEGGPAEVFIRMAKEGSTVGGLMDAVATSVSLGLQYGVPLGVYVNKFSHGRFEPSGPTHNPELPFASSLTDYVFRWLGPQFPPVTGLTSFQPTGGTVIGIDPAEPGADRTVKSVMKIFTDPQIQAQFEAGQIAPVGPVYRGPDESGSFIKVIDGLGPCGPEVMRFEASFVMPTSGDAPPCPECGALTVRRGTCHHCPNCSWNGGCG